MKKRYLLYIATAAVLLASSNSKDSEKLPPKSVEEYIPNSITEERIQTTPFFEAESAYSMCATQPIYRLSRD